MIHLERLQNDVFHLANSLITTYDLSSDQQQKLFEEVSEAILATVSTAILKVKERIKTIYVPSTVIPEEEIESSRLQEKTIELT